MVKIAIHEVPLSRRGHYLKLDYDGRVFRVAYYWPKFDKAKKKVVGENRIAIKRQQLYDALLVVFGEAGDSCPFEPLGTEAYIRSTPWGKDLPT